MQSFADFPKWYNIKDVVATLEAMQIMIEFHHKKGFAMLKPGWTLLIFANICLPKYTDSEFYLFFSKRTKICWRKNENLCLVDHSKF